MANRDTGNYGNTGGNPGNQGNRGQENPRGQTPGQDRGREIPGQGNKGNKGDARTPSEWERERERGQSPTDPNRQPTDPNEDV